MAITISVKKSNYEMDCTKLAFLRSDGICAFHYDRKDITIQLSNTFENEHVFTNKDSSKMLLACKSCNVQKLEQDILAFMHNDEKRTANLLSRLDRTFTADEISIAGKKISELTCLNSATYGDDLTTSEIRWILHKSNRINTLANGLGTLPTGTNFYVKMSTLREIEKVYDLSNCNVKIKL